MNDEDEKLYTKDDMFKFSLEQNKYITRKFVEDRRNMNDVIKSKDKTLRTLMICLTIIISLLIIFFTVLVYGYFNVPAVSKYNINNNSGEVNYNEGGNE